MGKEGGDKQRDEEWHESEWIRTGANQAQSGPNSSDPWAYDCPL